MKQQVSKLNALKLDVCSKIKVYYVFVCIFFIMPKLELLNFAR